MPGQASQLKCPVCRNMIRLGCKNQAKAFLIKKHRKRKQENVAKLERSLSECTGELSTPESLICTKQTEVKHLSLKLT